MFVNEPQLTRTDYSILFGDDAFISYSRADAESYVARLASQLAAHKFSCRFDQWPSKPGIEVPPELLRALTRSGLLVVVSTAAAGVSAENAADFTRRNARLSFSSRAALTVFALLVLLSVIAGKNASEAISGAAAETRRAEEATQTRQQFEAETQRQKTLAAEATRDRQQAEQKRDKAVAQQRTAEAQAAQSAAVARARELVSASVLTENIDPDLAVLIATQAVAATWSWGQTVLPEAQHQLDDSILASRVGMKFGENDPVASVAWSPDSKRLVTGNLDKVAKMWNVQAGRALFTLIGHEDLVNSVAWSEDDAWLATGSFDHTVKIWDAKTGRLARTLAGHRDSVNSVAFSHDGKWLATGSSDHTVKISLRSSGVASRRHPQKPSFKPGTVSKERNRLF